MNNSTVHQRFFHLLLAIVTIALAAILLPFFGAVFWGTILAILFQPMQRYLAVKFGRRRNLAAFTTLLVTILIVILPLTACRGARSCRRSAWLMRSSRPLNLISQRTSRRPSTCCPTRYGHCSGGLA